MEKAGDFLGNVVRRLNKPEAALAWLAGAWPALAGAALAAHTRPVRCVGGCLELSTDGKPWQQQLEDMKREICGRINQAWGGSLVREVKFVAQSGTARISHEIDNSHTPFVRNHRS